MGVNARDTTFARLLGIYLGWRCRKVTKNLRIDPADARGSDFEASSRWREFHENSQEVGMFFEQNHDDACEPEGKCGKRGYN
jgi:hypothetical protein